MTKRAQPQPAKQSATSTSPPAKRHKLKAVEAVDYGPFHNGRTTDQDTIDLLIRYRHVAKHFDPTVESQFIQHIPELLWIEDILKPYLRLPDLSILRRVCKYFHKYWKRMVEKNERPIFVPEDRLTVALAMELAGLFASRNDYSRDNTVKIQLGVGDFALSGGVDILCSNITLMGRGADKTTVVGHINIFNQTNVFLKQLCITHPDGYGLYMQGSETNVEVLDCILKKCEYDGIHVTDGASLVATRCESMENGCGMAVFDQSKAMLTDCTMHHNENDGLFAYNSVVDIHGKATDIHTNGVDGIYAEGDAIVQIHLPSTHNTSHDNGDEDRQTFGTASITNVND